MKKAERLNQELIFLGNKQGFQLKDLMEEFQISKRTALRDVEELEAMGLPFYTENGRYGGYKLINQGLWTPVYFNDEEIEEDIDYESFTLEGFHEEELELDDFVNDEH